MKALQVYADTSVFGGYFDAEFAAESRRFFDLVRAGRVKLLLSEVVVTHRRRTRPCPCARDSTLLISHKS